MSPPTTYDVAMSDSQLCIRLALETPNSRKFFLLKEHELSYRDFRIHKRASPHPQWRASSVPVRRRKEAEAGELAIGPENKFELGSTRADSSLLVMSGSEIQGLRASTSGSTEGDREGGMFAKRGRLQVAFVIRTLHLR